MPSNDLSRHLSVAACGLLLAACALGADAPGANATAVAQAPRSTGSAPATAPCPPAPRLDDSGDGRARSTGAFADDMPAFALLQSRFSQAYAMACEAGWLARVPLVDPKAAHPGVLVLANAPEANIASIYLDARDDVPADAHDMLLEYAFVESGRQARVPEVDELREAIYCRVVGASEAEQDASGRCLPD